jgi:AraC-like DNA-binding protein
VLDINALAAHYTGRIVTVAGVFKAVIPANSTYHSYTKERRTPTSGYVFIVRGSGSFIFNETTYPLQSGMVVHGGPQMTLTMTTEDSELEYILVRYSLEGVDSTAQPTHPSLTNDHFQLEPGANPILSEHLNQLYESLFTPGNMALLRTGFLFNMIIYELFASCLNRLNGNSKDMIALARDYIHNHYMDTLNLQKLADIHGTSPQSFSYFFKKYTGVFPIDYLIQHRMKRAQELLTLGNYSIKQVAASVGYEDALYFSRLYKKHFGYTPSQSQRN